MKIRFKRLPKVDGPLFDLGHDTSTDDKNDQVLPTG
jgi:hypothetical protein